MSEQPSGGHEVFISYSRAHALAQATALHQALLTGTPAIRAFKDDASLQPGEPWLQRLAEELAGCRRFVVLLGPEGLARWVGGEVAQIMNRSFGARAADEQPLVIPVLMGDTPPTVLGGWLSQFQSLHWPSDQAEPPPALLQALRGTAPATPSHRVLTEFDGRCPFVGLAALQADQAPLFFGREADLLACLAGLGERQPLPPQTGRPSPTPDYQRWLSIEGASGSGKSSLLRAGVLPLVTQGALSARTGLDDWAVVGPWLPGDAPLTELAKALGAALMPPDQLDSLALRQRLAEGSAPDELSVWLHDRLAHTPQRGVLIAIDQFEELFTLTPEPARQRLDALLAHALARSEGRVLLVSTCRSDYAHRIVEELPALGALKQDRQRSATRALAPLDRAAMTRAIQGPARLCGLDVSEVLPAVLEDARDDMAGALPLVQQALQAVWEAEQRPDGQGRPGQHPVRTLQLTTYERKGRLAGALAGQADAVLARLRQQSPQHEKGALELLLALAHWQPDGRHTRQHLPLDAARRQAGLGDERRGEAVLNELAAPRDATIRLVVISDDTRQPRVDLIHEALLRSRPGNPPTPYWATLLNYLEQHRDRQYLRDGLRLQALAWEQRGAGRKGTASYTELRRLKPLQPLANELEQRFLKASYWPARVNLLGIAVGALGVLLGAVLGSQANWQAMSRRLAATPAMVHTMTWLQPTPAKQLLPQAIEIPLGRFTYGCKVGRDAETCPEHEQAKADEADVDMAAMPGVCAAFAATEVTFAQYDHYVRSVRSSRSSVASEPLPEYPQAGGWGWQRGQRPVVNVSWDDAMAYAQWLSQLTHQTWRLPTEVEWEYAARAEHGSLPRSQAGPYWWGMESPTTKRTADGRAMANCKDCGPGTGQGTVAVASYPPNPFGLHDTVGNVWEWTASLHDIENKPVQHRTADMNADDGWCAMRGGSWGISVDGPRASFRQFSQPDLRNSLVGFRLCRASPIEPPASGAAGH